MSKRRRRQRRSGCGALFAALGTLIAAFNANVNRYPDPSIHTYFTPNQHTDTNQRAHPRI